MGSALSVFVIIAGHIMATAMWQPAKPMWAVLTAIFLTSALLLSPGRSFTKLFAQASYLHIGGILVVAVINLALSIRDRGLVENLLHAAPIGSFCLFGLSLSHRIFSPWYRQRG